MKKMSGKLEKIFAATAFAEEGEFEAARAIMKEEVNEGKRGGDCTNEGVCIPLRTAESES